MYRGKVSLLSVIIAFVVLVLLTLVAAYSYRRATSPEVPSVPSVASGQVQRNEVTLHAPSLKEATRAAIPASAHTAWASPPEHWLYMRAWTRAGQPAVGAEVEFKPVLPGSPEAEVDNELLPRLILDEVGEGAQVFAAPGQYSALCRAEGLAAYGRFSFGRDTVAHLDLVLIPSVEVTGSAVNTSGQGVPGVTVAALVEGRVTSETVGDDAGNFRFELPMPERCLVRGNAQGYATAISEPVRAGEAVKLVMTRGAQLVATVRDTVTRAPARDLTLELKGDRESGLPVYSGTTDASGVLNLASLTPGEYHLRSNDPARVLVPADGTVTLVLGETARVDLRVDASASVEGVVLDGDTGKGIPNVLVFVNCAETPMFDSGRNVTAADGAFSIPGLPAGMCAVRIMGVPPQYSQGHEFAIAAHKEIRIQAGVAVKDIIFELFAGPSVRGRVVFKDGTPAPGANVFARVPLPDGPLNAVSWAVDTSADDQGEFVLYKVPEAASFFVQASLRGRVSEDIGPLTSAEPAPIVLMLKDVRTGILAGQILNIDGRPMRAHVSAVDSDSDSSQRLTYTTEEDGFFLLADLPPASYELQFGPYKGGLVEYIDSDGPFTLSSGQTINDIRLQLGVAGLSISGVVRRAGGETVSNYMIEAILQEGGEVVETLTTMTDETGTFQMENLADGHYQLYPTDRRLGDWSLQVEAGEVVEIVIPQTDALTSLGNE